jgi:hypothetical protein
MTKVFGRLSKAADNAKRRENFSAFARCAAIALKNRKLLDQDSNLEQTGYTDPHVSVRSGLSHHPRPRAGGCGALVGGLSARLLTT